MDKKNNNKIILGISCGDINGVGLEILIKIFLNNDLFEFCTPILYAPIRAINFYKKLYNLENFNYHVIKTAKSASTKQFNVIKLSPNEVNVNPGESEQISGQIALNSLDLAIKDLKKNAINALITLPVNKHNVSLIEQDFLGHTEYLLKDLKETESLMLLCDNKLKIATVTNHIPISNVASSINSKILNIKLEILIESLKKDFLISKPKIAVLGLNPHAGDSGLIGDEDVKIIKPFIEKSFHLGNLIYLA